MMTPTSAGAGPHLTQFITPDRSHHTKRLTGPCFSMSPTVRAAAYHKTCVPPSRAASPAALPATYNQRKETDMDYDELLDGETITLRLVDLQRLIGATLHGMEAMSDLAARLARTVPQSPSTLEWMYSLKSQHALADAAIDAVRKVIRAEDVAA